MSIEWETGDETVDLLSLALLPGIVDPLESLHMAELILIIHSLVHLVPLTVLGCQLVLEFHQEVLWLYLVKDWLVTQDVVLQLVKSRLVCFGGLAWRHGLG